MDFETFNGINFIADQVANRILFKLGIYFLILIILIIVMFIIFSFFINKNNHTIIKKYDKKKHNHKIPNLNYVCPNMDKKMNFLYNNSPNMLNYDPNLLNNYHNLNYFNKQPIIYEIN